MIKFIGRVSVIIILAGMISGILFFAVESGLVNSLIPSERQIFGEPDTGSNFSLLDDFNNQNSAANPMPGNADGLAPGSDSLIGGQSVITPGTSSGSLKSDTLRKQVAEIRGILMVIQNVIALTLITIAIIIGGNLVNRGEQSSLLDPPIQE